ncbi:uncharacterized protein LOC142977876 isoform X3 [Anticarsia gemmatalis]|uniref:uncharacterized protein LOC142977876 isoform X3 n=1 Tax=Anticarsia gemmatalis TaxID=129554 RepID=UPI003F75A077
MARKSVSFNTTCNLCDSHLEAVSKWLSCNGEMWGVGPTAVFASAAALFLYNELEATVFIPGDQAQVSVLEKTLISTMMLGMLALMIHLWVCSMRFFQYYLDTVIKDSPSMLLEMTTAGLLGGQSDMMPLGPLTRFLRQQQPQIHITVCWFLSLCYADYVRKHYCQRFNLPYLEQWQAELQDRVMSTVHQTMLRVNSFVGSVHQRLRGYARTDSQIRSQENNNTMINTVRGCPQRGQQLRSTAGLASGSGRGGREGRDGTGDRVTPPRRATSHRLNYGSASSDSPVRQQRTLSRNLEASLRHRGYRVRRSPASVVLAPLKIQSLDDCPWRKITRLPFD